MRLYSAGPRKDLGIGGRVRMDLLKEDLLEFRLFELFSHPHKAKQASGGLLSKNIEPRLSGLSDDNTAVCQSESLYWK